MANGGDKYGDKYGDHWDGQTVTQNWDLPKPISDSALAKTRSSKMPMPTANKMGLPQSVPSSPMPQAPAAPPKNLMR